MLAAGAILLCAFLRHLRRSEDPLIEPTLLANRTYLSGIAVSLALFGAFGGLLLCISLYGQLGEGWSPIHAGLALMPMVVGIVLGMLGSNAAVSRLGTSSPPYRHRADRSRDGRRGAGSHRCAHRLNLDLLPGLFFIGAGVGATIGQLFQFILVSVNTDEVGSASGVFEAVQQLSTALGVAVLGTIFFSTFDHHLPPMHSHVTAWVCLVPLAATFLLVFRLPMHASRGTGSIPTTSPGPRRSGSSVGRALALLVCLCSAS